MATTRSPESYIGSLLNITSKSDIRYEGILFHINPRHSTIALQNVRCFGTEGRRNDGPEVPPSDVVYDCIYFRGSDIKDLKVLSSPTSESTHSIHDDPAIIECHSFHHPAPSSNSGFGTVSAMAAGSSKSFYSGSLPGLISGSPFHCSLHQYNQPISSVGSCISSLPAEINGDNGSSSGWISDLQQRQSFLQPPPPSVYLLSPGNQQMQYSLSDVPESSHSMPTPVSCGSDSVSPAMPSSTWSVSFPMGGLLSLAAQAPSYQMENYKPTTAIAEPTSSCTAMSAFASSSFELNAVPHQTADKLQPVLGSALPYPSELMPTTSTVGTSHSDHIEASSLSPVTPDQILLPGSVKVSSSNPLQMRACDKDIEVVQSSTSSKHASMTSCPLKSPSAEGGTTLPVNILSEKEPNLPLKQRPVEKSNRAHSHSTHGGKNGRGIKNRSDRGPSHPQHRGWWHNQGRIKELDGVALHTHHGKGIQVWGRGNKLGGTASCTVHGKAIQRRGKGNKLYGAASDAPSSNKVQAWGMNDRMNDPALRSYDHSWSPMKGKVKLISHKVTKFTEDFDFVAMNEKFNKDEIWGQLGKTSNNETNNKVKTNVSHEDNVSNEDADGLPIVGMKSVYVKDEFFDSLSCNLPDHKAPRGRVTIAERMKLDRETFGHFRINRGYRGGWGHRYRRVYGHARRDRGQTMRSCVA